MSRVTNCRCPVEDCKSVVDVVLKSSDGELFGAHQRNLDIYTEGFPIAGSSDTVSLDETAEVLRLMLRYTHHIRLPNLETIPFTLLASLAEAVEKYMIYSATENCRTQMTLAMYDHPNEVFLYSIKHDYPDLADKTANLTLKNPSSDFVGLIRATFQDEVALRWLRYRDCWMEILVRLPTFPEPKHFYLCSQWCPFQVEILKKLNCNLIVLDCFSDIINEEKALLDSCTTCIGHSVSWASHVRTEVANLPEYSQVI